MNEKTRAQLKLIRTITTTLTGGAGRAWLFGGWGLDARIGRVTRDHGDIEFWVDRNTAHEVQRLLVEAGAAPQDTQPPEESTEYTWDGLWFSTAYFDIQPDATFIQTQGRFDDWVFPIGSFPDDPAVTTRRSVVAFTEAGTQTLYTVVLTRLRLDPRTRAYFTRRRAEGLSKREVTRCLQPYLARELYQLLVRLPASSSAPVAPTSVHGLHGSGSATRSPTTNPATLVVISRDNGHVEEVEVVVAHRERATLRVGDVFLKIDVNQARTDVEVEAMAMAPIPTPKVLWRKPPVLALTALLGTALGRLGEPSTASSAAWAAAGAAARILHDAPLPPWPGRSLDEIASQLDRECEWLVTNGVLPTGLVTRNRQVAEAALRPWTPAFTHSDLQISHVFVDDDEITGVIDWSEAGPGDALYDLATLTLGHEEHLGDVVAGYGTDVNLDVIRGWWSLRSLRGVRWLIELGFDPFSPGCEVDVLRSQL